MIADIAGQLAKAGKAPHTIKNVLTAIKTTYKHVQSSELYTGPIPKIVMPQLNNQRLRFLTSDEAKQLLSELDRRSEQWGDVCRLSLLAGLRLRSFCKH